MSIQTTNNVSNEKKENKKVSYKKTHVFKAVGATLGLIGAGGTVLALKTPAITDRFGADVLPKIKTKQGLLLAASSALVGILIGALPDFIINKTVKNTTVSVNNLLNQKT